MINQQSVSGNLRVEVCWFEAVISTDSGQPILVKD
jgi:hypothetical protein